MFSLKYQHLIKAALYTAIFVNTAVYADQHYLVSIDISERSESSTNRIRTFLSSSLRETELNYFLRKNRAKELERFKDLLNTQVHTSHVRLTSKGYEEVLKNLSNDNSALKGSILGQYIQPLEIGMGSRVLNFFSRKDPLKDQQKAFEETLSSIQSYVPTSDRDTNLNILYGLEEAAHAGYVSAIWSLGHVYRKGLFGVHKNYPLAIELFRVAGKARCGYASYELSRLSGKGMNLQTTEVQADITETVQDHKAKQILAAWEGAIDGDWHSAKEYRRLLERNNAKKVIATIRSFGDGILDRIGKVVAIAKEANELNPL